VLYELANGHEIHGENWSIELDFCQIYLTFKRWHYRFGTELREQHPQLKPTQIKAINKPHDAGPDALPTASAPSNT